MSDNPEHPIKPIVGLGNPGPEYAATRHNVGAWLVRELARQHQATFRADNKFQGEYAKTRIGNQECWLLLPSTYMNHSGQSVKALASYYKITPEEILVAHDELDFPVGQIRFKQDGGHGGHNGLRDIIQHLQSKIFHRLRIGIDHPGDRHQVVNYVLKAPSRHDEQIITTAIDDALRVLPWYISGEQQRAIRELHSTV